MTRLLDPADFNSNVFEFFVAQGLLDDGATENPLVGATGLTESALNGSGLRAIVKKIDGADTTFGTVPGTFTEITPQTTGSGEGFYLFEPDSESDIWGGAHDSANPGVLVFVVNIGSAEAQDWIQVAAIPLGTTDDIPTAGAIADQVWDEAAAGHVGAGSMGALLSGIQDFLDAMQGQLDNLIPDLLADLADRHGEGKWGNSYPMSEQEANRMSSPLVRWLYGWRCTGAGPDLVATWGGTDLTAIGTPDFQQDFGAIGEPYGAIGLASTEGFQAASTAFMDCSATQNFHVAAVVHRAPGAGGGSVTISKGVATGWSLAVTFDGDDFTATFEIKVASATVGRCSITRRTWDSFHPNWSTEFDSEGPLVAVAAFERLSVNEAPQAHGAMRLCIISKNGKVLLSELIDNLNVDVDFSNATAFKIVAGSSTSYLSQMLASVQTEGNDQQTTKNLAAIAKGYARQLWGLTTFDEVENIAPVATAWDFAQTVDEVGDNWTGDADPLGLRWCAVSDDTWQGMFADDVLIEWTPEFGVEASGGLWYHLAETGGVIIEDFSPYPLNSGAEGVLGNVSALIKTDGAGNASIVTWGTEQETLDDVVEGDRFRIAREGADVKFYRLPADGGAAVLLYTDEDAADSGLLVGATDTRISGFVAGRTRGLFATDVQIVKDGVPQVVRWISLSGGVVVDEHASIEDIKAKTDNLPSDPADQSLIIAATNAIMTRLGTPNGASVSADIARVLGLQHENAFDDNWVYSGGDLVSLRRRVFASKAACQAAELAPGHANGADGEIHRYTLTWTYSSPGVCSGFAWVRDL